MTAHRDRRVYATLLGVAVLALVGDRLVFSGGGLTPSAATAQAMTPVAAAPVVEAPAPLAATPAEPSLSERLKAIAADVRPEDEPIRDAFHRAAVAGAPAEPAPSLDAQRIAAEQAAKDFASSRRVNSILFAGSSSIVVIDGKRIAVGEELDGFRLVEARQRAAIFSRDGVLIELPLE